MFSLFKEVIHMFSLFKEVIHMFSLFKEVIHMCSLFKEVIHMFSLFKEVIHMCSDMTKTQHWLFGRHCVREAFQTVRDYNLDQHLAIHIPVSPFSVQ